MDISNIPLIVQSPSAAAIALVLVEGEQQPRAVAVRNVEAGQHSYFYGDFASQKPYVFRCESSATPVSNADLAACVPSPLVPAPDTWACVTMLPEEGMALIKAALDQSGGDAVLASDRFAADLDGGKLSS